MSKSFRLALGLAIALFAFSVRPVFAQKLETTVLYRQNSDTNYSPVIPGYTTSNPEEFLDCAADVANEACSNSAHAAIAPGAPSINVVGTTLSLLLPDGRVAVVNCATKYAARGTAILRRNCAMPLVEHVEAEFNGHNAKLKWLFDADSRKTESENYKIVALLDKR